MVGTGHHRSVQGGQTLSKWFVAECANGDVSVLVFLVIFAVAVHHFGLWPIIREHILSIGKRDED